MMHLELLTRSGALSITDVAHRWGFCHMGKFDADYKAMFGELPSHTSTRMRQGSSTAL